MKEVTVWIEQKNDQFWRRVQKHAATDISSLCVFRIIAGLFLMFIYLPSFSWIAECPQAFFRPPHLSAVVIADNFPGRYFFIAMDIVLLSAAFCITTGIRARMAARVFALGSLLCLNFQYSFGRIDHSILLYCLFACMSFTNWGTRLAVVPDKENSELRDQQAMALLAVVICFAFFSAGFEKALHWLNADMNKSGTASWTYSGYYFQDRRYLLASWGRTFPFYIFKCMDIGAVALELSPLPVLLFSRKLWRSWLFMACAFHLLNVLFLNIHFLFNAVVYIAFADFSNYFGQIKEALKSRVVRIVAACSLFFACSLRLTNIFTFHPAFTILIPESAIVANLLLAASVWVGALFIFYLARQRSKTLVHP